MGRPRSGERRSWPPGLYERRKNGRVFYVYKGIAAAREVYLGTDLNAAKRAVAIVTAKHELDPVQRVIARIEQPSRSVAEHCDWYDQHIVSEKRTRRGGPLSVNTLYEIRRRLRVIRERWGSRSITGIDRRTAAELLASFSPTASNQYRALLRDLFDSARAEGLREDNPVEGTRKRIVVVQRTRLPIEDFHAIRETAAPWMQRAMDLALYSLQRREDLVVLHEDEHWKDGRLFVRQQKVEGKGHGLLRIKPGPQLLGAILACLNSDERADCLYLLHRIPTKRRHSVGRTHFRQLSLEMLTKEFQRLREALKLYPDLPALARPSWHEIRSTGADEYRKAGWPEERIRALLGHAGIEMTREYLGRRAEQWADVDG